MSIRILLNTLAGAFPASQRMAGSDRRGRFVPHTLDIEGAP
ncbi:MAG: hypothetical protein V4805_18545 [Pseudomonadota bacterium]